MEFGEATAVVLTSRLCKTGQKIGEAVGAAFAVRVLELEIERGDDLKLPLDSLMRVPTFSIHSCVLWPNDLRNIVPHSTL